MDAEDPQASSKADAATVKQKRRSSILKNQQPPRTPFSDVEFNVATPPETTKSRRVSFSKRTGVAEFITNEATTTWRNFYEEQNQSLESSGNENNLVANAPRQTIEHIGKRIFDQQFEEVEAFDLEGTIHTNLLQQFVPSQSKFEQSALTELSRPFGNDIQCPVLEDMTNPISMNFSTMQPLSSGNCDDFEEIQNDLERCKPSAMCPGPMNLGKDFSGYIEVAYLDVTHGPIHNDGSEMSITDTVESSKVVQLSKQKVDNDWTNDKENILFNPYVAPKESLTFAVNKVSDEVLVFDGKRLTTQSIINSISENKENLRQCLLPNAPIRVPQRKTIILDVNDDSPNFIDNNSSKSEFNVHDNLVVNIQKQADTAGNDKSMVSNTIDICKESKLQTDNNEKRRTILFANESCDISMTQALPTNINVNIVNNDQDDQKHKNDKVPSVQKRKTIMFDEDSCNISITQGVPVNIIVINSKTNNDLISGKDCSPEKRRFDQYTCDLSMTQALPTNIVLNEENEDKNCYMFKDKVKENNNSGKRNTIIFNKNSCDISMTQVLPTNIILQENIGGNNEIDKNITNYKTSEKRKTIIFDKDSCDISMTQALPANINLMENLEINNDVNIHFAPDKHLEKRRTIIFDKESCNMSVTQALPGYIDVIKKTPTNNKYNKENMKCQSAFEEKVLNEISEERKTKFVTSDSDVEYKLEVIKTIPEFDDSCKSTDYIKIEHLHIKTKEILSADNIEVTDFCKTYQQNTYEEIKNEKPNISVSNSIYPKNVDVKDASYSHVSKSEAKDEVVLKKMDINDGKHLLVNKISDHIDVRNENEIFEHSYDKTSQNVGYKLNTQSVSVYQVDTNNQLNKITTNSSNDKLVSLKDIDQPIELFKDKTIHDEMQKNKNKDNKTGPKKSILDELLSMSSNSVKNDVSKYEKDDKTTRNIERQLAVTTKNNDSIILIDNQTYKNDMNKCRYKESHALLKSNIEKESDDKDHTKVNMELEESINFIVESSSPKTFKSVKEADNTKDLLKMLSDITDEDDEESICKQENIDVKAEGGGRKPTLQVERNTTETKEILQLPMRISLAPQRQSIAISREDLWNNISMAKAALQLSRFEVDETDIMDDTSELVETHEINDTHKSVRLSSEVVKTLQFEDEPASDTSIKSEIRMTSLRKPTLDEITSINDKNKNVIPTFITDVSVSVKELTHDLVKPNCDASFENNFSETNAPLTRNAEVEVNLITSSQIDVTQDEPSQFLLKNSDHYNISKEGIKNMEVEVDSVCLLHDIKSSVADSQSINIVQHSTDKNSKDIVQNIVKNYVHDMTKSPQKLKQESIVFNSNNPLNNVLLPPIDYSDAHSYNQYEKRGDDDKTKSSSPCKITKIDDKSSGSRTHDHFDEQNDAMTDQKISEHMNIVCGEITSEKSDRSSGSMCVCEPKYAYKSVESVVPTLKDIEGNTIIVMKENRDLIQSSSLTLVDEKVSSDLKIDIESSTESSQKAIGTVPSVKILFRNENDHYLAAKDSEAILSEEISNIDLDANTRKRSYSPTSDVQSNVKVTPKPLNKMQKMCNSPLIRTAFNKIDMMQVDEDETMDLKKETEKYIHTEIVQKVEVQYNSKSNSKVPQKSQSNNSDMEKAAEDKYSLKLSFSSDSIQDPSVAILQVVSCITSANPIDEEGDKIDDYDPNVVENIKRLSFMDTSECEWEENGREAWSFRLLCGRVRALVRLCGATITDDTRVTAVDFEVTKADEKDAIAGLCVSLAMEAMQYEAAEVTRADAVAAMLERCVRVARLARRWARAMRDAYLHLAYRVLPGGNISLNVAILPLRRVVEVRLHVSLVVPREHGVAYPRVDRLALASEVELATKAGPSVAPASARLDRLADQTPDWGNVPRTIWKVFRYLKNMTRNEELTKNWATDGLPHPIICTNYS